MYHNFFAAAELRHAGRLHCGIDDWHAAQALHRDIPTFGVFNTHRTAYKSVFSGLFDL